MRPLTLKFLIVDDFSTMRRIIRNLLKEIGYGNADEAEDGPGRADEAARRAVRLRRVRHQHAEHERVRAADQHPWRCGAQAPAGADGDRRGAQGGHRHRSAGGASGYIVKPFTKATLEEKLLKILQKLGKV
jgi:two-component system chemotaxis response regulator CheY